MTMLNWYMVTSRPRTAAGATSAMYMGERFEANPMAMPPEMRQRLKAQNESIRAVPIEETTKMKADMTRSHLRPNLSLRLPETMAPSKQPTRALAIAQPLSEAVWSGKNRS